MIQSQHYVHSLCLCVCVCVCVVFFCVLYAVCAEYLNMWSELKVQAVSIVLEEFNSLQWCVTSFCACI